MPATETAASDRSRQLSTELHRLLAEVARQTDELVRHPGPSSERVHQLHRAMRRLRVGLELWGRLLRATDRAEVEVLARRLKRLARLVGEVRDRDIVLDLLERPHPRGIGESELRRFHRFLGRLRDDARTARELLRAFLTTERDAGFFENLRRALDLPPRRGGLRDLDRLMAEENRERYAKVHRAHRRASARPSSERLHGLRIRLRQFRHVSELTRAVAPVAAHPVPAVFRRLQDQLGKLHDLDVALATLDPDLERSPWAAQLRELRRKARTATRGELGRLLRTRGPELTASRRARSP